MNILETITDRTRQRILEEKAQTSLSLVRSRAEEIRRREIAGEIPSFEKALSQKGLSFICEVKRASPSKGLIAPDFPYLAIAKDYEAAGAAAISCLTEPYWFQGSDRYLKEITEQASIPVLRKDFTCDEYIIYQAKALGASAILLICSVLEEGALRAFLELSRELGLAALVEAHDPKEILLAKRCGARILGVNNRNLRDFTVDIHHSERLRSLAGPDMIFVSESGVHSLQDLNPLLENGTDAVLIGEYLMRAKDRKRALKELRAKARERNAGKEECQ